MLDIPGVFDVEVASHQLVGVCEVRAPEGGEWLPLFVISGSVTLNELGSMPGRSCTVNVLTWTDSEEDVFNVLSPFGSWVRLFHDVTGIDGVVIRIPLGYFRVTRVVVNFLAGSIEVTGDDAGILVADYQLTTLKSGEVLTTTSYADACSALLTAALDGIPSWWTSTVVFDPSKPTAKPVARIQRTGSRVDAVSTLAAAIGMKVGMPLDGSAVFRMLVPTTQDDQAVTTVRGGQLGNLDEINGTIDRTGITNVAIVKWQQDVAVQGARIASLQRRLVSEYVEPTSDIRAGGPFGRVTLDVDSSKVTNDADASAAAQSVLIASLNQARDFQVQVSPIYGLESGDVLRIENTQGTAARGILVGGTLGLTAADPWTLIVRAFAPLGRWSSPRRTFMTDESEIRDAVDWRDATNKNVDLTGNTARGWIGVGGTVRVKSSGLLFTANGAATSNMHTSSVFTMPTEHRAKVAATIKSLTRTVYCRAFIDPNQSGARYSTTPVRIDKGKTRAVSADLDLGSGTVFAAGVDIWSNTNGGTVPANTQCVLFEMDVAVATRAKNP